VGGWGCNRRLARGGLKKSGEEVTGSILIKGAALCESGTTAVRPELRRLEKEGLRIRGH